MRLDIGVGFGLFSGFIEQPWRSLMRSSKSKTDKKRVAAKPRPARDVEINRAEPAALSSPLMGWPKLRWAMIPGFAFMVAAASVYAIAVNPRQTSTPTQPQYPVQEMAP